jgi:FAD/FMN-containing dehydrogenase
MLETSLRTLLGPTGWLSEPEDVEPFLVDWSGHCCVRPIGVARPASTADVAATVKLCARADVVIIPQGGRTGLVAGNFPHDRNSIILSLSRMNKVEPITPGDFCVSVGAGVVLGQLHAALNDTDLILPLHLGSEGSAQIGGLIATNAGGNMAFRYGMMQDMVLGLEVVLPDGEIWNGMRRLIKDNCGFQLRRLFCGSEGRLGIITGAVLKLQPAPRSHATALMALPDLQAAVVFGETLRRTFGEAVIGLEFINDTALAIALQQIGELKFPFDVPAPAYLLAEIASTIPGIDLVAEMENALAAGLQRGQLTNAVIAQNNTQRAALWKLRDELPEGQRREGPQCHHDVSVPVSQIAEFVNVCSADAEALVPGIRVCAFGHMGDGNIHYNFSTPAGGNFDDKEEELSAAVYARVDEFGGSVAAEHGLGRLKTGLADTYRSASERDLMRRLRVAFNPTDILNPGVIVD